MRTRRTMLTILALLTLVACSRPAAESPSSPPATPSPTATTTPSPTPAPAIGAVLEAPPKPSDEDCDRMRREDTVAALGIRTGVDLSLIDIGHTKADVDAAIADAEADLDLLGIPLRPAEVRTLRASGMYLDGIAPLGFWVFDGRSDLFGSYWIDPPGSGRYVVGIVDGTPSSMALVQCLVQGDFDIRFVYNARSWAELSARKDQVIADLDTLRDEGIPMTSVGSDVFANAMELGVDGLTDDIAATLRMRYGDDILLKDEPPAVAD